MRRRDSIREVGHSAIQGLPPQCMGASHFTPMTVLKLRGQCSGRVLTICSSR